MVDKFLYFIHNRDNGRMLWQRAPYIEDGPYIEHTDGSFIVKEIESYGGETDDTYFITLKEALDHYYYILENHT